MKKLLFVAIFLCVSLFANAQEHLTFNDVEINGPVEDFIKQLGDKGFTTIIKHPSGIYMMAGKYMDTDGMAIVTSSSTTKNIVGVAFMCSSQEKFSQTTALYFKLKEDLAKAYGHNAYSVEGKKPNQDEIEDLQLAPNLFEILDKTDGIYCTVFRQDVGDVYLTISLVENVGSVVMIYYADTTNFYNAEYVTESTSDSSNSVKEHLEILGIPLNGNIKDFEAELFNKGFVKGDNYSHIKRSYWYQGSFTGREVSFGVGTTPSSLTVFKVMIMFKMSNSWDNLESLYNDLKRSYIAKYGNPLSIEKFESPYDRGNTLKLYALENGKGEYYSIWHIEGVGYIMLKIDPLSYGYANVVISYEDEANSEVLENEKRSDI